VVTPELGKTHCVWYLNFYTDGRPGQVQVVDILGNNVSPIPCEIRICLCRICGICPYNIQPGTNRERKTTKFCEGPGNGSHAYFGGTTIPFDAKCSPYVIFRNTQTR
jgi:hypothetical protein